MPAGWLAIPLELGRLQSFGRVWYSQRTQIAGERDNCGRDGEQENDDGENGIEKKKLESDTVILW